MLLINSFFLAYFDPKKLVVLACDASPYGVRAVLSHKLEDGTEKPISFASYTLAPAERNYTQLDKEALAIMFGVKHFITLFGITFSIQSYHKLLQYLLRETQGIFSMASTRVQRWALTLSAYTYVIRYKTVAKLTNAVALSRLTLPEQPKNASLPGKTVLLFETMSNSLQHARSSCGYTRFHSYPE